MCNQEISKSFMDILHLLTLSFDLYVIKNNLYNKYNLTTRSTFLYTKALTLKKSCLTQIFLPFLIFQLFSSHVLMGLQSVQWLHTYESQSMW